MLKPGGILTAQMGLHARGGCLDIDYYANDIPAWVTADQLRVVDTAVSDPAQIGLSLAVQGSRTVVPIPVASTGAGMRAHAVGVLSGQDTMKVLNPSLSIIIASHMKPRWLPSSLDSIIRQTRNDIQIIVADSGAWIGARGKPAMQSVYERYSSHPLIDWITLNQQWPTPLAGRMCAYTWVWNRILESGLVNGEYVAFFTDDDLYTPFFVEKMIGSFDSHPEQLATYCGQDRIRVATDGTVTLAEPTLLAEEPITGPEFLYRVDMIQMVMRRHVF